MSKKNRTPTTLPTRVSFRLDEETALELARSAAQARTSPGTHARNLVRNALLQLDEQDQDTRAILAGIAQLATLPDLLRTLRIDLASSVGLLLVNAGRLHPEEARRWVEQNLLPAHPSPEEP